MIKIKFDPIHRDRLFFDQYEYSLSFVLTDAGVLREKTVEGLKRIIQWRNQTRVQWARTSAIIDETLAA